MTSSKPQILPLKLSSTFPSTKALQSFQQSLLDYQPAKWENDYSFSHYLAPLSQEDLHNRYESIVRNLQILDREERHPIPIDCPLSSWYWYKKEHETRLELHLRKLPPPIEPPFSLAKKDKPNIPLPTRVPNGTELLFRYDKKEYLVPMYEMGEIRISPASTFKDGSLDDPRTDNELEKNIYMPSRNSQIITQSGKSFPIKGPWIRSVSIPNYYMFCTSCDYAPFHLEDFNADSCLIITKPKIFAERIEQAVRKILPDWYFIDISVSYFDPHQTPLSVALMAGLCKDFRFAYQMEYRFLWDPMDNPEASGYKFIKLGPLNDIAELYIPTPKD